MEHPRWLIRIVATSIYVRGIVATSAGVGESPPKIVATSVYPAYGSPCTGLTSEASSLNTGMMHFQRFVHMCEGAKEPESPSAKELDDATLHCVNFQVRRITRLLGQFYDAQLRPSGIKATQFTVLSVIKAYQPISQSDLAAHLVMDVSTLTRDLRILKGKGLVSIVEGDNGTNTVRLSKTGENKLNEAKSHWQKAQDYMLDSVDTSTLEAIENLLKAEPMAKVETDAGETKPRPGGHKQA